MTAPVGLIFGSSGPKTARKFIVNGFNCWTPCDWKCRKTPSHRVMLLANNAPIVGRTPGCHQEFQQCKTEPPLASPLSARFNRPMRTNLMASNAKIIRRRGEP